MEKLKFLIFILTVGVSSPLNADTFEKYYRENSINGNGYPCIRLLSSPTSPIEIIARHVELKPSTVSAFLKELTESRAWAHSTGVQIGGSRTHKMWGSSYDLDVYLLPAYTNNIDFDNLMQFSGNREFGSPIRSVIDVRRFYHVHNLRIDISPFELPLERYISENMVPDKSILQKLRRRLEADLIELEGIYSVYPRDPLEQFMGKKGDLFRQKISQARESDNIFFSILNGEINPLAGLNPDLVRKGFYTLIKRQSFPTYFSSPRVVIVLKENDHSRGLLGILKSLGYEFLFLIDETGNVVEF